MKLFSLTVKSEQEFIMTREGRTVRVVNMIGCIINQTSFRIYNHVYSYPIPLAQSSPF